MAVAAGNAMALDVDHQKFIAAPVAAPEELQQLEVRVGAYRFRQLPRATERQCGSGIQLNKAGEREESIRH